MCTAEMTIQHFVEYLLQTENSYGKKWLEEYIWVNRGVWDHYSRRPIASESLTFLLYGISSRVTFQIRNTPDFQEILAAGRSFLEEVGAKGRERDLEPDLMALDAIIVPKKFGK